MSVVLRLRPLRWSLIVITGIVLALIFSHILQPGYDLYIWFYPAAHNILQGQFSYAQIPRLNNPPWILLLLTPLAILPPAVMHGALVVATLLAMFSAMRDYRRFKISYPLAVISMPMLSIVWLGQLEVFALLGVTLGYWAVKQHRPYWLSLALLLLAAKPQETWIVGALFLIGAWRQWSLSDWLKIVIPVLIVVIITSAWLGADWLARTVGGAATYARDWENFAPLRLVQAGPQVLVITAWLLIAVLLIWALLRAGLSRGGIALAATGANLLSPYLTNPHLLMTMCLGWGYLFDRSTRWGMLAYLASLTPLLRLTSGDQSLNPLDVIFPSIVFVGLQVVVFRRQRD